VVHGPRGFDTEPPTSRLSGDQTGVRRYRELVHRMVEEVWNGGDADASARHFAPDLAVEVRRHHEQLVRAFSDLRVEILDLVAEGDRVAARLVVSGVHDRGPFAGRSPTGRRLTRGSFRFWRIVAGTIAETWAMQDRLALMEQLGAVQAGDGEVEWASGG
jgi:predicted ester cyclase